MTHSDSYIVSKSARFISKYAQANKGLSEEEELIVAEAFQNMDKYNKEEIFPALKGVVTVEAIKVLMADGSSKACECLSCFFLKDKYEYDNDNGGMATKTVSVHCSGVSEQERDQLLANLGAGPLLMKAHFDTTYYGVPQMWHPREKEIKKEIKCRSKGAKLLSMMEYRGFVTMAQYSGKEGVDEVLNMISEYGLDHMTLDYEHTKTKKASAKAMLKILVDNNLTYGEEKMKNLKGISECSRRGWYC